mmetsp:Transcript_6144/g.10579  ORF Transcript_6144/g.10579 Transcript_6144/m.10579 type:complete len:312 (-) Transcript_6144:253-1188(-)
MLNGLSTIKVHERDVQTELALVPAIGIPRQRGHARVPQQLIGQLLRRRQAPPAQPRRGAGVALGVEPGVETACRRYHPGLALRIHHVRKALTHGRQDVPRGLVIVTHGLGLLRVVVRLEGRDGTELDRRAHGGVGLRGINRHGVQDPAQTRGENEGAHSPASSSRSLGDASQNDRSFRIMLCKGFMLSIKLNEVVNLIRQNQQAMFSCHLRQSFHLLCRASCACGIARIVEDQQARPLGGLAGCLQGFCLELPLLLLRGLNPQDLAAQELRLRSIADPAGSWKQQLALQHGLQQVDQLLGARSHHNILSGH